MIREMAAIAKECIRTPGKQSKYCRTHGRYVTTDEPENAIAEREQTPEIVARFPPLNPAFKLVFLTMVGGSAFFTVVCLGLHAWLGDTASPALVDTVKIVMRMAQIGFGVGAGLLGGPALRSWRLQA